MVSPTSLVGVLRRPTSWMFHSVLPAFFGSLADAAPIRVGIPLLPRHQHLDVLLRIDQVAMVVFTDLEFDPVDLAGELAALYVALGSDRRSCLVADVETLVRREDERLGCLDAALADLIAIVVERYVTALCQAAAVVGELGTNLVLTWRHGIAGLGGEDVDPKQVVGELRLAVFGVETPAADGPTLGDHRPAHALLGHDDLDRNGERLVLHAEDAVLGQVAHTRIEDLGVAPD